VKDANIKPSLRISHIVYGRIASGNRVTYLIDPSGTDEKRAIPETVVLSRWRKRKFPGYVFSGSRLSSTFWRGITAAFGTDARSISKLSQEEIQQVLDNKRNILKGNGFLTLPNAETLHAIILISSPNRLQKMIDRHISEAHKGKSGVPDLFLFARSVVDKKITMGRFVEVKKPEEPLSKVQIEELYFMNSLGFNARVLRLIERVQPTKKSKA
jgi:hypothetical protein